MSNLIEYEAFNEVLGVNSLHFFSLVRFFDDHQYKKGENVKWCNKTEGARK